MPFAENEAVGLPTIIVSCPADRPDLRPHFEALAVHDGWLQHFIGVDASSGAKLVVKLAATEEGGAELAASARRSHGAGVR